MKQGTLTLHIPGREELYWMATVVATGLIWMLLRDQSMGQSRIYVTAGTALVMILLKLTLLRHWHTRRVDWTLDEEKLTLDGAEFFRSAIHQVSCRRGNGGADSWILTFLADNRAVKCYSLMKGKKADTAASAQALKELATALDPKSVEEE